nr:hypothetical protein [Candidatus Woesearchaeota archaeon]
MYLLIFHFSELNFPKLIIPSNVPQRIADPIERNGIRKIATHPDPSDNPRREMIEKEENIKNKREIKKPVYKPTPADKTVNRILILSLM